jgi:hypothetical protein
MKYGYEDDMFDPAAVERGIKEHNFHKNDVSPNGYNYFCKCCGIAMGIHSMGGMCWNCGTSNAGVLRKVK